MKDRVKLADDAEFPVFKDRGRNPVKKKKQFIKINLLLRIHLFFGKPREKDVLLLPHNGTLC